MQTNKIVFFRHNFKGDAYYHAGRSFSSDTRELSGLKPDPHEGIRL